MYHFQSTFKTHDLPGNPPIQFSNYEFSTDDPVKAERVRRNLSNDIWETTPELYQEIVAAGHPAKKRGRPPKVQVNTGMKLTDEKGEGQ